MSILKRIYHTIFPTNKHIEVESHSSGNIFKGITFTNKKTGKRIFYPGNYYDPNGVMAKCSLLDVKQRLNE